MNGRAHSTSSPRRPIPTRLDAHLGYWLRYVSKQFSQALGQKLTDEGVSLAEWVVLRELYEGDRRPSALAEQLGLTRGAISKLARRLVASLLITQQASRRGDGRAQMLALTDLGRTTVRVLSGLVDETDQEFFGELDARTRALIMSTMRNIVRRHGSRAVPVA